MLDQAVSKATAYDRYIDYRRFSVAVALFVLILMLPIPDSMLDVAVEYTAGKSHVQQYYAQEMFGRPLRQLEQWQLATVQALEACMRQGVSTKQGLLKRGAKDLGKIGVAEISDHFSQYRAHIESLDADRIRQLLQSGKSLRHDELSFSSLPESEQNAVMATAGKIRTCIAMVAFVVACFVTEAIPLPGVAFCIGLILVFSGIVSRQEVAQLYWSDACWFIMGSLMFAAAFVKTGVDKRICLFLFRYLAKPSVRWLTAIFILVIAPAAAFISDHALAAIFLPIGLIIYHNSLTTENPEDKELAKMLMITIAMACNIGGFGSPSGGARNVIIMTYLEDMFGISIGYGQWIVYAFPFVLIMMPLLWMLINWRFKPKVTNLRPALEAIKRDIDHMGGWTRHQVVAVVIFVVMLAGWITESNVLAQLIGVRLGIGVIAVAGAVAYLLLGIVNWRDYHDKVDWGVVWLYAGAIIFGRILDESGGAYWMARSIVEALADIGLRSGVVLVGAGAGVTGFLTNLMADGPAAAAVGPITLNMAAVANPGSSLIPFMGLATACASSFAYMLIIGTPPNAIVYASGYLTAKDFLRVGAICFVAAFALLLLMTMFYWPMLGFSGLAKV